MSSEFDVIVIGAGAAGLMCAAEAGKRGRRVLVVDHAKKPGRKILISGGGRCNFTNYDVTANNFLCQNPHFVKSALSQYTNWDFISLVSKYGVDFEERDHGQLFCLDSAKDIVDVLLKECDQPNITQRYRADIHNIQKTDSGFSLHIDTDEMTCESLVVATGGLSMPKLGATPFGYQIAEQFGLDVISTTAGLVPFTLHKEDKEAFEPLSGVAVPSEITAEDGTMFKEALLFTHRGLSGPAVLQISSFWQAGQKVTINLVPEADVLDLLTASREKHPNQSLKNTLSKVLPKRLVETLIDRKELVDKPLKQFNDKELQAIETHLENWQILPNGTEGYRTAEVTLGGLNTDHLSSKTMECKNIQGLYFIGEVVDVTGWLGGYNFQWAWSSGFVAGQWA
ncbi:putative flavoprotein, HI0933 family [Vibrio nigripulchritudo SFn27]|uniref:Putative flavoprotein, HI0933 family n=1 Tax=Vibrio nigripulchritudo TaxID=28173 RepID=U4KHC9_9VIBR|nr:NAD(P)/FAD-dependent oxidoreductase [Vibrio nigripulchritudo]CCN81205.1 putative flavoprotein, HI0933 family [Vibrio nigripulchritudo BLFn1]CCN88171.1 putative flavoprotein, HI0933 family [Vibrio nigripulchritudo SFn27]CCN96125.1 putative flavoprotein, HI0933 family [Vibrio nigripulchritudo ENn2]CCO42359.1 putative flavoprotein, HI0933 family [Vibrio nigripulchritudo SFn135]CCO53575.1 putative flavoprotein, HI0933 family [Vibrio nigripulchritudo Wn13]